MQIGVLTPVSACLTLLRTPIDLARSFSLYMSAKSPLNISCANAQISTSVGGRGVPKFFVLKYFGHFSNIFFLYLL